MSHALKSKVARFWRDYLSDETGAEAIEYIALGSVLGLLLFVLGFAITRQPDLADKSLLIAVFSAIVGGIAWSGKQAIDSLHRRAQLIILEKLSDGKSRKRDEIANLLKKEGLTFRFMPLHLDALAELTLSGKIVLDDGKYKVASVAKTKKNGA